MEEGYQRNSNATTQPDLAAKVNNRNTRAMCEICSKLAIKTP